MSITDFNRKRAYGSYASVLENRKEEIASSHQIKRFFDKLALVNNFVFRRILCFLFVWRLSLEQPDIIILQANTVVLDNDDANRREGLSDVVSVVSYPNTIRRKIIDFAVKIIIHSEQIIMKVTQSIYDNLNIALIWKLSGIPPQISFR